LVREHRKPRVNSRFDAEITSQVDFVLDIEFICY